MKTYSLKISELLLSLTLFFCLVLSPLNPLKTSFLALINVLIYISLKSFFMSDSFRLKFTKSDFIWGIFLFSSLISIFYGQNKSLSIFFFFSWSSLIIWMIIIRSVLVTKSIRKTKILSILNVSFVSALFLIFAVKLCTYFSGSISYFNFLNANSNFIGTYVTLIYVYLVLFKYDLNFIKYFIVTSGYCLLMYSIGSNASILIFFIVLCFRFLLPINLKLRSITSFSIVILVSLNYAIGFSTLGEQYLPLRQYLFKCSMDMFRQNFLFGHGIGNWVIEINRYTTNFIEGLNHPFLFYRVDNHNFYSTLLSDLGFFGFAAYISAIYNYLFRMRNSLSSADISMYFSIIIFLLFACVYGAINFSINRFSEISFLIFTYLGILSSDFKLIQSSSLIKVMSFGIKILGISALLFFTIWVSHYRSYNKTVKFEGSSIEKVVMLDKSYSKYVYTMRNFKNPIAYEISNLYFDLGNLNLASLYVDIALLDSPFDPEVMFLKCKILRERKEFGKAFQLGISLKKLSDTNDINILLADLAIDMNNFKSSKFYIQEIKYMNMHATTNIKRLKKRLIKK